LQQNGCEDAQENERKEEWFGDGLHEIEAAAEEDDDTDTTDSGECGGWAADVEDPKKCSTITCDGDEQENTPEECLGEMETNQSSAKQRTESAWPVRLSSPFKHKKIIKSELKLLLRDHLEGRKQLRGFAHVIPMVLFERLSVNQAEGL